MNLKKLRRHPAVEKTGRHLPALGALLALHLAIFARLIFQSWEEVPYAIIPFDFTHQYSPWLVYIGDCLKSGIFPLWVPYVGGGTPFFINPQSQLYSPLTLVVGSTIGYTHRATQLQTLFTIFFGGVGSYFLSYTLWRSRFAGVFTAICYTFTSAVFGNLEHMTITNSTSLAPWLFLATTLAARIGARWSYPALAFLIYFLITSGYPGVIIMLLLWLLLYTLYLVNQQPGAYRTKVRALVPFALAWLLGLFLAGAHWISIVAYRKEFTRGASPLSLEEALLGGHLFFKNLLGIFFLFMTEHPPAGDNSDISMRGVYFGALALPLAFAALLLIKERITGALLFLSAGSLLMAGGGMFFGRVALHILLPVLNMSRFPSADSRALMVLGLALLAGGGAMLLGGGDRPQARSLVLRSTLALLVLFVVSLFALRNLYDEHAYRDVVLNYVTLEIILVGLAVLALKIFSGRTLLIWLAALVAIEAGTCVLANMKIVGAPTWGGDYRARRARHRRAFTPEAANEPRIAGKPGLIDEASGQAYMQKNFYLSEYNPLRLLRFQRVIENGFEGWMTNGRRVVALAPDSQPQTYADFEPLAQPVDYVINSYTPNRVVYRIKLPQDSLLVFNEINFPGWQATIDGRSASISEVGGGLRSMRVVGGEHTIVTTFRPAWFYRGLYVSLIAALLFLAWLALLFNRARRERRRDHPNESQHEAQESRSLEETPAS
ncbi:MAG TPA: hypothetical protein VGB73_03575 [Pyrinomonadaceae bacterium]|jgi:hypothetical protein